MRRKRKVTESQSDVCWGQAYGHPTREVQLCFPQALRGQVEAEGLEGRVRRAQEPTRVGAVRSQVRGSVGH